jgi:hypothetical protein
MRVNKILFGQVIRLATISGSGGGDIYGLNLTKACEERYGFLESPRHLADYDLSKGVTFLHGYFNNRFVIDKFQVYSNGLLVAAKVSTDECDEFLNDVVDWVTERGGIQYKDTDRKTFYSSNIEAELAAPISAAFPQFSRLGQQVSDALRTYGHIVPDMDVSALALSLDPTSTFRIERREGMPVDERLYFCVAPLRTADHIRLLEEAEKILFG